MTALSIPITNTFIKPDQGLRFQSSQSFIADNPKRFPIFRTTQTDSDGTRVITITYSDKSTETRTEKPVRANVATIETGRLNILI